MKTILFISPTGTLDNGAEISIFNLMKFLASEGYRIINIAPTPVATETNEYSNTFRSAGIECHLINSQRWWWEDAPGHLLGTEIERAVSYREAIKKITDTIEIEQVDIVISNTVNVFQGALAAAIKSRPHYWLIHEFPENEFAYYMNKLDFIDTYSTEIFAVTGSLQKRVKELFPNRNIKSFSPFTEIEMTLPKKGTKKRLVSIGRLSERKNQLELIKAFEKMNVSDLELLFVGGWDEQYKEKCNEYIKTHHLSNINFSGNKQEPWAEITDKDLCVFPSAMETFGLVYVEALLKGIPVILSDNPGHTSAYEMFKFGEVYPTGDVEYLAKKITSMLTNFEEYQENSIKFIENTQKIYEISTVYKEIIEEIEHSNLNNHNSVRHIANLVILNENKSKLAKLEYRIRYNLQRILYRIRRR